mmetsp:Transcript_11515/g.35536  ORF Transcript_11515/g.35536 Transcript_11515/m.35536 type:complete len:84 (+) Transcript_11515:708-959(+)
MRLPEDASALETTTGTAPLAAARTADPDGWRWLGTTSCDPVEAVDEEFDLCFELALAISLVGSGAEGLSASGLRHWRCFVILL